jgi:hypothetical protein
VASLLLILCSHLRSPDSPHVIIPEVCEALIDAIRTYVKVSECNHFYSMCCTLRDPVTEFVKLTLVQYENKVVTGIQHAI